MPEKRNTSVVILQADALSDLESRIDRLKTEVPLRAQNSSSGDREQWQIQRLLTALFRTRQLPVPVRLYKRDAPDFLLETASERIGIETTEAINPDYVRAQMHPAAQEDGAIIDPSLYKWGTQGRPKWQIREEAGRKQLSGCGWVGDSVEREFIKSIIDVVRRKSVKLHSHYKIYDSNRLLVYHNLPSPAINIEDARMYATKSLEDYWDQSSFDTVYVLKYNWMLYFTKDASGILFEFPRSDAPLGMDTAAWERLEFVEKLYLKSLEVETEIDQLISTSDPEPEPDYLLSSESDLQRVYHEWLDNRARSLIGHGCRCLLLPPDKSRLRTISEIAACPAALELFRGRVSTPVEDSAKGRRKRLPPGLVV